MRGCESPSPMSRFRTRWTRSLLSPRLPPAPIPPYNGGMSQVRIVVVDDQPLFRRGLVAVLEAGGLMVVGAASSVREAAEMAARTQPDLVVADLRLADGSGIDLVR